MPRESMKPLNAEYKEKLDAFITENYNKLKEYAVFLSQRPESDDEGEQLLHTASVILYEGRQTLDFKRGSVLAGFQHILKSVRANRAAHRQTAFENGRAIKSVEGQPKTYLSVAYSVLPAIDHADNIRAEPSHNPYVEWLDRYGDKIRKFLSPSEKRVFEGRLAGKTTREMWEAWPKKVSIESVFEADKRVKRKIKKFATTRLQADSLDDLVHQR